MKTTYFLAGTALFAGLFLTNCNKKDEKPKRVQRTVSGTITDSVWTAGSEITITNHITLPANQKLRIEEGVTVLFADTVVKPEFIVKGNLYVNGTASNPVRFTIPEAMQAGRTWGEAWGGILPDPATCTEILINYAEIAYGGAVTTEESPSVKEKLYKAKAGENVPAIWFGNETGKLVVMNSVIHNQKEDGLYIDAGQIIVANNLFYTTGHTGADAVNTKSGTKADVCFNIMFSPNTNSVKTSNGGGKSQADIRIYNNTMVNSGWRRPTIKGGSIWLEDGVIVHAHNNLFINNRFGIKRDTKKKENANSTTGNNLYYGHDSTTVAHFQTNDEILGGTNDIRGTTAGSNDPKLVNYPLSYDKFSAVFNTSWDFRLKSDSPCLTKGNTSANSHYSVTGLTLDGKVYKSPAPANYIGAKGTN
ncbi:MAG: right-handed parallel beta-helix repeat-containing protein [Cytophagales bacterium]